MLYTCRYQNLLYFSYDKKIKIWNVNTFKCLKVIFPPSKAQITCMAIDDENLIYGTA